MSPPSVGLRNFIVDYPQTDIIADTQSGVFVNTVIGAPYGKLDFRGFFNRKPETLLQSRTELLTSP